MKHHSSNYLKIWGIMAPSFQSDDPYEGLIDPACRIQVVRKLFENGLHEKDLARSLKLSTGQLARCLLGTDLPHHAQERLPRLLRILSLAYGLFEGDLTAAARWVALPAKALGGEPPMTMTRDHDEVEEVCHVVGRLEWGVLL